MITKKYTVILADLDNTILDFTKSEHDAVTRLLSHFGCRADDDIISAYSAYNDSLWQALERGELTRKELINTRFTGFFEKRGIDGDGTEAAVLYERYLSESAYFTEHAEEFLIRCRGKYRVYIISNGTAAVQLPRIANSGVDKLTDGYFISEIVGHNKPDKLFFDYAASHIPGFERKEALVLGDSITADVAGGNAYGIDTCLYDRYGRYSADTCIKPDHIIKNLADLFEPLDI